MVDISGEYFLRKVLYEKKILCKKAQEEKEGKS